ncbi:MAG: hypothetical protein H0U71_07485 [Gammaproteobacteria bacterium]|nr:hypothetical protein [Gammaproteobacteria bacterium]
MIDKELASTKRDLRKILTLNLEQGKFSGLKFFRSSSEKNEIDAAQDFPGLLQKVVNIEKRIYSKINCNLSAMDKNIPLANQDAILKKIRNQIAILVGFNKVLTKKIPFFYTPEDTNMLSFHSLLKVHYKELSLEKILQLNFDADIESVTISNSITKQFLMKMLDTIMLSILKANLSSEGQYFLSRLAASLQQNEHDISLMLNYKSTSGSLEISPENMNAYAEGNDNLDENETLQDRVKDIKKNTGASSALIIPVWPEHGCSLEQEYGVFFKDYNRLERSVENLVGGSFSYDENENIFYTPFHLEIMHEFIHALHNSRGTNRELLSSMHQGEKKVWKDAEEYWTIKGANISENFLNKIVNAPPRYGHGGFSASAILHPEDNQDLLIHSPLKLFNG